MATYLWPLYGSVLNEKQFYPGANCIIDCKSLADKGPSNKLKETFISSWWDRIHTDMKGPSTKPEHNVDSNKLDPYVHYKTYVLFPTVRGFKWGLSQGKQGLYLNTEHEIVGIDRIQTLSISNPLVLTSSFLTRSLNNFSFQFQLLVNNLCNI